MKKYICGLFFSVLLSGQCSAQPAYGEWGIDITLMDSSIKPGDNFHEYVNGKWLKQFAIPADRASYGALDTLNELSTDRINSIIQDLAASPQRNGSLEQKIGTYYSTWLDHHNTDKKGRAALSKILKQFQNVSTEDELLKALANREQHAPFRFEIFPDPANTTQYAVFVMQSGLGLPNRDFYFSDDPHMATIRSAYLDYVSRTLDAANISNSKAKATALIKLEEKIAQLHWTETENRDIQKIYNPMTFSDLQALAPAINWQSVVDTLGIGNSGTFVVMQPNVIAASSELIKSENIDTWKSYLAFHFIRSYAESLPIEFGQAHFDFYQKTLKGIEAEKPRDRRAVELVSENFGEGVGKIYAQRYFPESSKKSVQMLVENILQAMDSKLKTNSWMDEETRKQAQAKLASFEPRIGYPDKWKDYSSLEIKAWDALGNARRIAAFNWQQTLEKVGKTVDREAWVMITPQSVNAMYNPLLNQITFAAGILQAPFFDPSADPAVNYGAIGAVIGHEIGHGFDDQGRRTDAQGRIRDWWTPAADEQFKNKANALITQYNQYEVIDGLTLNGQLTLGENIGDLGGLSLAYAAFQAYKLEHGDPGIIDGFTSDQRFFLSWAHVWRHKTRSEMLKERLSTSPHSPAQFRVNGVVRNMDAWYEAFNIQPSDALYLAPDQRVNIW